VYQEKTAAGRQSNFNKLIHPGPVGRRRSGSSSRGESRSRSSESKSTTSRSHRRAA
jgi:hypothetical protein